MKNRPVHDTFCFPCLLDLPGVANALNTAMVSFYCVNPLSYCIEYNKTYCIKKEVSKTVEY